MPIIDFLFQIILILFIFFNVKLDLGNLFIILIFFIITPLCSYLYQKSNRADILFFLLFGRICYAFFYIVSSKKSVINESYIFYYFLFYFILFLPSCFLIIETGILNRFKIWFYLPIYYCIENFKIFFGIIIYILFFILIGIFTKLGIKYLFHLMQMNTKFYVALFDEIILYFFCTVMIGFIIKFLFDLFEYNSIKKRERFSLTGKDLIIFLFSSNQHFKIKCINLIRKRELLAVSKENEILLSDLCILFETSIKNKNLKINIENLKSDFLKEYFEKNILTNSSLLKKVNSELLDEINLLLDYIRKKL